METRPPRLSELKYMYYTYVLQSKKDNKLYVGYTEDLKKRITLHNNGKIISTKNRRPLKLIYYEACLDKRDAIKREKYFKTGFGRRFLNNRLENFQAHDPSATQGTSGHDGGRGKTKSGC